MHHDEVKAQAAGLPSVFGHGMFSAGVLARALTDYVGVGTLQRYKMRFVKQTWPGETFSTKVTVAGKRKENGANLVDLVCELTNQNGEVKVAGEATAALPSRG
jgi:acyl dehydratase